MKDYINLDMKMFDIPYKHKPKKVPEEEKSRHLMKLAKKLGVRLGK